MPDTRELEPVAEAAQEAAALGDYATAERLLRELAELQESRLGSEHPDLANTLNNLGVVCDFADKPDQAEQCYRRALAIAKAAFAPGHSIVVTSEQNLRDFCAARGRPFESPAETAPHATEGRQQLIDLPDTLEHFEAERQKEPASATAASAAPTSKRTLFVVGGAAVVVVAGIVAIRSWSGANARPVAAQPTAPPPAAATTPVTPPPTPVPPILEASATAPAAAAPAAPPKASRSTGLPEPTVASARLCRNLATESRALSDWPCDGPGSPAAPGSLFFYTRVRSARDTTVEHRWYNGDRLFRVVELEIRSSPTDGYRTYSRNTVDGRNGGEWRVELRTKDGAVLHEERLTVRPPS